MPHFPSSTETVAEMRDAYRQLPSIGWTGSEPKENVNDLSQEAIVLRAQQGESELFYELVRPHLQALRNMLHSFSRNDDEVDDVLQQALLLTFSNLHQLRSAQLFRPWLFKIAINEMRRLRRSRAQEQLTSSIDEAGLDDGEQPIAPRELMDKRETPFERANRNELSALLHRQLDKLPAQSREVFLLHHLEQVSIGVIARKLGMTEAHVRNMICRARFKLRELLSPGNSGKDDEFLARTENETL